MKSEVTVRPWVAGDLVLLVDAESRMSERTLRLRFWSPVAALPARYLDRVEQRWPSLWDAVVAIEDGRLVGWAEYGRYPDDPNRADVAVCVVDAEQGHGIGTTLLRAVLHRARTAGLVAVHADIDATNVPARHAWRAATGGGAATFALAG